MAAGQRPALDGLGLEAAGIELDERGRPPRLARLAQGEATVNDLAKPFDISLPAISRHLKVLESAGLITRGREAQWRPCKLKAEPLKQLDGWLSKYRPFWEGSFDRMDAYLTQIQKSDTKKGKRQ